MSGGAAKSDTGRRIGLACTVLGCAVAVAAFPSGAASQQPRRALGPLDLAKVRFDQRKTRAQLEIETHGSMPSLKDLDSTPSRVVSSDQRYLCLQLQGRKVGRNLLCPAGAIDRNKIVVGHSTYGRNGSATRRDDVRARVVEHGDQSLKLRFSLADAGLVAGKFRWRVISGWTGDECLAPEPPVVEPAPEPEPEPQPEPLSSRQDAAPLENLCIDSKPTSGFVGMKIYKLKVVGCRSPGGMFRSGPGAGKRVALTFDDGPSSYTTDVIEVLDRYGARGTFFALGSQVGEAPRALRLALKQGHELANHSYNHESLPGHASMKSTSARIEEATGFTPCQFRPPYGNVNGTVVSDANSLGMSTVLWDVDPRDWAGTSASGISANVIGNSGPGSIVVMHDGGGNRSATVAALPGIIESLQGSGYKLVTVTEILGGKMKLAEDR